MRSLTLKQVPDRLLKSLRKAAADQRRSVNQQVIYMLEKSLEGERPSFGQALARLRETTGPLDPDLGDALEGLRSPDRGRKVRF